MTEILRRLYHMVDEWADRQPVNDPKLTELLNRQDALQEEIIQRLGEGGPGHDGNPVQPQSGIGRHP